ncbi:hypothetical protein HDU98_011590, partial [Podochytrium sp. JEL0797]
MSLAPLRALVPSFSAPLGSGAAARLRASLATPVSLSSDDGAIVSTLPLVEWLRRDVAAFSALQQKNIFDAPKTTADFTFAFEFGECAATKVAKIHFDLGVCGPASLKDTHTREYIHAHETSSGIYTFDNNPLMRDFNSWANKSVPEQKGFTSCANACRDPVVRISDAWSLRDSRGIPTKLVIVSPNPISECTALHLISSSKFFGIPAPLATTLDKSNVWNDDRVALIIADPISKAPQCFGNVDTALLDLPIKDRTALKKSDVRGHCEHALDELDWKAVGRVYTDYILQGLNAFAPNRPPIKDLYDLIHLSLKMASSSKSSTSPFLSDALIRSIATVCSKCRTVPDLSLYQIAKAASTVTSIPCRNTVLGGRGDRLAEFLTENRHELDRVMLGMSSVASATLRVDPVSDVYQRHYYDYEDEYWAEVETAEGVEKSNSGLLGGLFGGKELSDRGRVVNLTEGGVVVYFDRCTATMRLQASLPITSLNLRYTVGRHNLVPIYIRVSSKLSIPYADLAPNGDIQSFDRAFEFDGFEESALFKYSPDGSHLELDVNFKRDLMGR